MNDAKDKRITKEQLRHLARMAGLDLEDERLEALAPQVERLFAGILRLDELSLGETEPTTIFTLKED